MVKDSGDLSPSDTGEPFEELIDSGPIAEILEERCNGHARATENPRPANPLRVSLDLSERDPLVHLSLHQSAARP